MFLLSIWILVTTPGFLRQPTIWLTIIRSTRNRLLHCSPGIGQFLQGFLPGLALKLFLMFLPRILMLMSKIEGHISQSQLERVAAGKLFVFLVRIHPFWDRSFVGGRRFSGPTWEKGDAHVEN
jgi:hypothetical protein